MNKLRKADLLLFFGILAAAFFFLFIQNLTKEREADRVEVTVNGVFYASYSLLENRTVKIEQSEQVYNLFEIKDGSVKMLEASCPDKLCVNQKALTDSGGVIICLPNQVVIEVKGRNTENKEIDSVAG